MQRTVTLYQGTQPDCVIAIAKHRRVNYRPSHQGRGHLARSSTSIHQRPVASLSLPALRR